MSRLTAHFDGKTLVPHGPLDLAQGEVVEIELIRTQPPASRLLSTLADWAETLPPQVDSPGDAAAQHDHYLYGTPKRP